jgi:hypothetical protein
MALKRPRGASGTLVVLEHRSKILQGDPLGDPHVRKLAVWLPPQYDDSTRRRFPTLYDLAGFTGSGLAHTDWRPFSDNVPERAARLLRDGKMGPAIIVFPDCFTALGGNQYGNAPAIGAYADDLTREIVPFVDREFRTLAAREHRGCFGKSSGGYGAMLHGMRYAQTWGAIANHSGDAYFDLVYWHDWPNTLNEPARMFHEVAPECEVAAALPRLCTVRGAQPLWIIGATRVCAAPAGAGLRSTPRQGRWALAAAVSRNPHPACIRAVRAPLVEHPGKRACACCGARPTRTTRAPPPAALGWPRVATTAASAGFCSTCGTRRSSPPRRRWRR